MERYLGKIPMIDSDGRVTANSRQVRCRDISIEFATSIWISGIRCIVFRYSI